MKIHLVRFSQSGVDMSAGENDPKDGTGDKAHPKGRWQLPVLMPWFTSALMGERTKPWLSPKS